MVRPEVETRLRDRVQALIEKGDVVLATHQPNPPNVMGFATLDAGQFTEWRAQVEALLASVLGESHVYVQRFNGSVQKGFRDHVKSGQGILRAVQEDLEHGLLSDVRTLLTAEIFTDFLEMAEHLLDNGYKDPAASLIGAVLEDGLRRIATSAGVTVKGNDDLGSLSQRCADAGVYNRLTQKKVHVWNDIRNNADHGHFEAYGAEDVADMLRGVASFLTQYLS